MSAMHIGVVWNPSKTGHETLESGLEAAIEAVLAAGSQRADAVAGASVDGGSGSGTATEFSVSWHETSVDDPGRAAAQGALDAGATVVLAAGGDGTVRAVAEHLAETGAEVDLGVIPLGTGNLLARNLGIPLNSLPAAFERALVGESRPLDIGWAEITLESGIERHAFAVMAGFGIDAHMITETNDDLKDRAGWLAYVESLGRALSASEVIDLRLTLDGGSAVPERAHTLIVGNCGMLQGGITLLPDADPADGELDLLVLRADGIVGWADTLRNMVWDNGLRRVLTKAESAQSSATTAHERLRRLTIELDEARIFEVDGDDLGATTRIEVSVQEGAIRVRC